MAKLVIFSVLRLSSTVGYGHSFLTNSTVHTWPIRISGLRGYRHWPGYGLSIVAKCQIRSCDKIMSQTSKNGLGLGLADLVLHGLEALLINGSLQ